MKDAHELRQGLRPFTGCDQPFVQALFPGRFYTDGVKFFLDNAGNGAHWFFHIIASEPKIQHHIKTEGFAVVTLLVTARDTIIAGRGAKITVDDGDGVVVFEREIERTDCPVGEWKFYLEMTEVGGKSGSMMMLPQER